MSQTTRTTRRRPAPTVPSSRPPTTGRRSPPTTAAYDCAWTTSEAEFRWDEIGAVESETSRFGRWYTITVHTPERRWYPVELRIPSRAKVKEWEKELDEVLDAYFQE